MGHTLTIQSCRPHDVTPWIAGPKLLNAIQNMTGLPVIHEIGMASPLVVTDIAAGGGEALNLMLSTMTAPLCGLTLCASMEPAVKRLLDSSKIMQPG